MASLTMTVVMAAVIGAYTQYEFRVHHVSMFRIVPQIGIFSVLWSVITGIIAMRKENASPLSITAVILGLFSVAFYVQ